jgi:hypothetical protein
MEIAQDERARMAFTELKGWPPGARQQPYEVLVDIDTFLFEFRSAYEILGKFLLRFFAEILGRRVKEAEIRAYLESKGIDMSWSDELREHRKLFFHEQAPWLAVRVANWDPWDGDLIILAHAGANPEDSSESIPFQQMSAIYSGMAKSLQHLHEWLLDEIALLEQRLCPSRPSA